MELIGCYTYFSLFGQMTIYVPIIYENGLISRVSIITNLLECVCFLEDWDIEVIAYLDNCARLHVFYVLKEIETEIVTTFHKIFRINKVRKMVIKTKISYEDPHIETDPNWYLYNYSPLSWWI